MSRAAFKLMNDARKGKLPPNSFRRKSPKPPSRSDLHVYGFCAWTGTIDKVGRNDANMPCCPHCGSLLMQIQESMWQAGLQKVYAECMWYADFFRWKESQNKCWPTMDEAAAEYCAATGHDFKLPLPPK